MVLCFRRLVRLCIFNGVGDKEVFLPPFILYFSPTTLHIAPPGPRFHQLSPSPINPRTDLPVDVLASNYPTFALPSTPRQHHCVIAFFFTFSLQAERSRSKCSSTWCRLAFIHAHIIQPKIAFACTMKCFCARFSFFLPL